jgi:hypothetical protein
MLAHPNLRLTPLELLALNKVSELLPRILEQSLLRGKAFSMNSRKTVHFSFNAPTPEPKYVLVDNKTKKRLSPPLYTYRQRSYLLSEQNTKRLESSHKKHWNLKSPVYNK